MSDETTTQPEPENCWNCGGTGRFRGGGRVENGRYIGYEGVCYRCEGKGYESAADRRRNSYYDRHVRRVHI